MSFSTKVTTDQITDLHARIGTREIDSEILQYFNDHLVELSLRAFLKNLPNKLRHRTHHWRKYLDIYRLTREESDLDIARTRAKENSYPYNKAYAFVNIYAVTENDEDYEPIEAYLKDDHDFAESDTIKCHLVNTLVAFKQITLARETTLSIVTNLLRAQSWASIFRHTRDKELLMKAFTAFNKHKGPCPDLDAIKALAVAQAQFDTDKAISFVNARLPLEQYSLDYKLQCYLAMIESLCEIKTSHEARQIRRLIPNDETYATCIAMAIIAQNSRDALDMTEASAIRRRMTHPANQFTRRKTHPASNIREMTVAQYVKYAKGHMDLSLGMAWIHISSRDKAMRYARSKYLTPQQQFQICLASTKATKSLKSANAAKQAVEKTPNIEDQYEAAVNLGIALKEIL